MSKSPGYQIHDAFWAKAGITEQLKRPRIIIFLNREPVKLFTGFFYVQCNRMLTLIVLIIEADKGAAACQDFVEVPSGSETEVWA